MFPVAQPELSESKVVERSGVGGVALDSLLVRVKSFGHFAHIQQGVSAVGSGGTAAEGFGALENPDCLRKAALIVEQDAVHVHGFRKIWIARKRPPKPGPCPGRVLFRCTKLAPGYMRFHLVWIEREGFSQVGFGFLGAAALALQNRQVDPAGDQVGAQLDRSLQRRMGLKLASLLAQQTSQVHPCGGEVRPFDKRATIAGFGFFELAHAREDEACGEFGFRQTRAQRNRLPVAVKRLLIAAHDGKRIAEPEKSGHQRRLTAQRQAKFPNRLFRTADRQFQLAQTHPGQGIHSFQANGLLVGVFRLVIPVSGLERLAERDPGRNHGRRLGRRGLGHLHRGFRLAAGQRNQADSHQRLRLARVLLEHLLVAMGHLSQPAGQQS